MKKRIVSVVLSIFMLISLLPVLPIAADTKPTIYIAGDVYGAPGETITIQIGFRNMAGKNIQQLELRVETQASVVETTSLQLTPPSACQGYANANNGIVSVAGGVNSFSPDSLINVQLTVPEKASEGETFPLDLAKSELFPSVLQWADGTSPNGDVIFEGATLHVTRFKPVTVSVKDTMAAVGDDEIHVPIVMSASNARLSSCTGLSFTIGGSAANKVEIDRYASIAFGIQGKNTKYTVMVPEADTFCLGYSAGFENAVAPTTDEFQIFELVLKVTTPLAVGDKIQIDISANENAFKVYGDSATDTNKLYVTEYNGATLHVDMPYEWSVLNEDEATAQLKKYTGSASVVEIPSYMIGNGTVGTAGKIYKVVELYGSEEEGGVFCENTNVTAITIPESVKTVQEYAFFGCTSLKKLVVKSPDMQVVEEYGQTFLHYLSGRNYKLLPAVVIESYESATMKAWADNNGATFKNLVAFAGVQLGSNQLRFVGAMADLEYQNVRLEIVWNSKTYNDAIDKVFTTLQGSVNGTERPVVTTDAKVHAAHADAHYIEAYCYLFGYELTVTANATFTVTPKATTAHGVEVSGKTVTVTYQSGQISYS